MKKIFPFLKAAFVWGFFPLMLAFLILWFAGGCSVSTEGIHILAGDYELPQIKDVIVDSSDSILIQVSKNVRLEDCSLSKIPDEKEFSSFEILSSGEYESLELESVSGAGTDSIRIDFAQETEIGKNYILFGRLVDSSENTVEIALSFKGFNCRPAKMIINEVNCKYDGTKSRAEFVEFYVLEDGNLSGLELCSTKYGEEKKYIFPCAEVKKGEYICLHLRVLNGEEELCVDELGSDLTLSQGSRTSSARDLWYYGNAARISDTDVLLLKGKKSQIIDGIPYCAKDLSKWNDNMESALELLCAQGLWSGEYMSSVGASATSSMSRQRQSVPSSKENWIVVKAGNASPGLVNSTVEK